MTNTATTDEMKTHDNANDAGYPEGFYNATVHLTGDPNLHTSFGAAWIETSADDVALSIPDRFGHTTLYTFTHADWAKIVEAVQEVEAVRA